MIKRILILSLALCTTLFVQAQTRTVSGKVTDSADGAALPGVNVLVKGSSNGTVTDIEGAYSVEVSDLDVLVFSFIGYLTAEQPVGAKTVLDLGMEPDVEQLDEVVVTALGISRDKKSLTYAAQEVDGEELTKVKDANFMNSLTGKAAGVFVNRSGSGVGGSTRVVLRGNSSTRNNSVLYVIDGVPMNNFSPSQPSDVWGQNFGVAGSAGTGGAGRDGGDGVANINPEDIESINVLKGASAAALYGSQAANGVILITTKRGKAGKVSVSASSNFTSESVLMMPEMQFNYGQTSAGALDSWGGSVDAKDHVSDFFDNGKTWINTVSVAGGNEMAQTYFSYANTDSKGIIPSNELQKHNVTFKESLSLWQDRLKMDGGVSLITQSTNNRANSGMYFNPLTGLYFFPRGLDFDEYKNNYETFDANRNFNTQNWVNNIDVQQNPYWILNRNQNEDSRNRVIGNIGATLKIVEGLTFRVRGNIDKSVDRYEQRVHASTQATLSDINGRYVQQNAEATQMYGDALLMYNKTFEKFSVSATVGTSITDSEVKTQFFDSKGGDDIRNEGIEGLFYANTFNIQNIAIGGTALFNEGGSHSQLQSVFGSLNLGYNGMLFLDVTGRNDWSSTLPDTDFFYPSVGLTAVISEMVDISSVDLLKVRASFAQVGNAVNAYDLTSGSFNSIIPYGTVTTPTSRVEPGQTLNPEMQNSFEVGAEVSVLDQRVSLDVAYYNTVTENQRIPIVAPASKGGGFFYINGGEIVNKGIEAALTVVPVSTENFTWTSTLNFTKNINEVKALPSELEDGRLQLTAPGVNSYAMMLTEGSQFGDIYGQKFARNEDGVIIVDADGRPQVQEGGLDYVGNPNPDYMWGWNNNFNYKGISLGFLVDARIGGEVMSITEAMNDLYGVSKATGDARDAGGVDMKAVYADGTAYSGLLPAQEFYTTVGGRAGITEQYVYSATNIRLREMSIGYSLPSTVMEKLGPIKTAKLSLIGRNLFFLKNDAPFDPDVSMSTGTGLQGVHVFGLPSTRSIGFNLSLTL
ncbi:MULTISPECIES: SusC/RagA family TonB-linked outer membrane protein [Reichenbachiella]|uniref:SusC/RagA family TonB-linked outer membrane protein n=1 Tax=Reichenbachiella TaxID=156993 RepID=UPI000E6BFEE7|nr:MULTISPECIES: SusC/RagA family TonB-linked outer membrane protein [Reichenbachiella]MBU2913609.1 SusC/RagA family TonB-linked outer membrane protein [Reichenbachiella agariperforans]